MALKKIDHAECHVCGEEQAGRICYECGRPVCSKHVQMVNRFNGRLLPFDVFRCDGCRKKDPLERLLNYRPARVKAWQNRPAKESHETIGYWLRRLI